MSQIILYGMHLSSPSRSVHLLLKQLGIDFKFHEVDLLNGDQKTEEFLELNPLGRAPVLKDGEFVVYESRAIAGYLVNMYGGKQPSLYPSEPKARALVDQMLYVGESTYEMIMKYVDLTGVITRQLKPVDENIVHVTKALNLYEKFLSKTQYIAADYLTIADFFMISGILILECPGYSNFSAYPKTIVWIERMKALPYFDEVNKAGMEMLIKIYSEKCEEH